MTFDDLNLNKPLLLALKKMGLQKPTPIQYKSFNTIMSGKDVCGIAQTGTGKTFAYLLPILRQFVFTNDKTPTVIILVPTRELVLQVLKAAKVLSASMSIEIQGVYGGVNMRNQMNALEQGCNIVIGTPGRLYDLFLSGSLKLKAVKKLVIDEMDEMLNLGFRVQIERILDNLPEKRQNLLFSATITDDVEKLLQVYFKNPEQVTAAPTGTPLLQIEQSLTAVPNFNTKINYLSDLLKADESMTKVLAFVSTKKFADKVFESLTPVLGEQVGVIHSNKAQNNRFATVQKFEKGDYTCLIATDIIARGLDVAEVTHVINFDIPDTPENYIHRIGRTGRADKKGIAISFATEKEMPFVEAIEQLMQQKIALQAMPETVTISDQLITEEMPVIRMKTDYIKPIKRAPDAGSAFHEKSAKNSKTNKKVSHKDKMQKKYGKPKSRPKKR